MSEDTIVLDRDNRYRMLGAQNLNGITCFLNATLFAMYCRSDSCFDTLLYSAFEGPIARFATMVRLWVNMVPMQSVETAHYSCALDGLFPMTSLP